MRGRSRRSPSREAEFLEALAAGWSVKKAAETIGVARRTAYGWRGEDEDFARLWDDAVEAGTDLMEDEAIRRAVEGVPRPVFYQGQIVGSITEYSDFLLDRQLRARRKDKYSDRQEQHVSAAVRVVEVTSYADVEE
jgi:hypothetical protein